MFSRTDPHGNVLLQWIEFVFLGRNLHYSPKALVFACWGITPLDAFHIFTGPCLISVYPPHNRFLWWLPLDDLKNSTTNFENEEELSSSNTPGTSYSTIFPAINQHIFLPQLAKINYQMPHNYLLFYAISLYAYLISDRLTPLVIKQKTMVLIGIF